MKISCMDGLTIYFKIVLYRRQFWIMLAIQKVILKTEVPQEKRLKNNTNTQNYTLIKYMKSTRMFSCFVSLICFQYHLFLKGQHECSPTPHKLSSQVSHIWGNHRGTKDKPCRGKTTL